MILMSQRRGAPYEDQVLNGGKVLIYEGHNVPRSGGVRDPKRRDQQSRTETGKLTPNGKFEKAARDFKEGTASAELVCVYEKIRKGIWTYNGVFKLVDVWQQLSRSRKVFKFRLELVDTEVGTGNIQTSEIGHNRLIPAAIKREVFKRDKGRCVICGSKDNLHFDHDFPFSKGGTSIRSENIRLFVRTAQPAKARQN